MRACSGCGGGERGGGERRWREAGTRGGSSLPDAQCVPPSPAPQQLRARNRALRHSRRILCETTQPFSSRLPPPPSPCPSRQQRGHGKTSAPRGAQGLSRAPPAPRAQRRGPHAPRHLRRPLGRLNGRRKITLMGTLNLPGPTLGHVAQGRRLALLRLQRERAARSGRRCAQGDDASVPWHASREAEQGSRAAAAATVCAPRSSCCCSIDLMRRAMSPAQPPPPTFRAGREGRPREPLTPAWRGAGRAGRRVPLLLLLLLRRERERESGGRAAGSQLRGWRPVGGKRWGRGPPQHALRQPAGLPARRAVYARGGTRARRPLSIAPGCSPLLRSPSLTSGSPPPLPARWQRSAPRCRPRRRP